MLSFDQMRSLIWISVLRNRYYFYLPMVSVTPSLYIRSSEQFYSFLERKLWNAQELKENTNLSGTLTMYSIEGGRAPSHVMLCVD